MTYPVVQTIHEDSILLITESPADVPPAVTAAARALARQAVSCLSGAGIFGCATRPDPPQNTACMHVNMRPNATAWV